MGTKRVPLAPQSVKKLSVIATNVNIGSEVVPLNISVVAGLGSLSLTHLGVVVNSPPTSRISAYTLISQCNTIVPAQFTFITTATSIDQNGSLPIIKDLLNQIASV